MPDREKVLKGLERCKLINKINCDKCPYDYNGRGNGRSECTAELAEDALAFLKEQQEEIQNLRKENNSILTQFHEWTKEQKAVEPKVSCTEQRCGNCNKVIEMDGWKACPWCGKMIDWERWWQKNGTSGTQTGKPQENRRDGQDGQGEGYQRVGIYKSNDNVQSINRGRYRTGKSERIR